MHSVGHVILVGARGVPGQCVLSLFLVAQAVWLGMRHDMRPIRMRFESVICRVIFALGTSLFQRWIWWKFRFLQACVGNFDTVPPWKVVRTYYLDISYVAFKYFDFLSVSDKLELLGHVHEPPWWFECYFRRSSWIHCWLLLAVLTNFIIIFGLPFLFVNFGVYPGLHFLVFPLWSVENVLEWRDRLSQVAELVKRVTPNPPRVCSILNQ